MPATFRGFFLGRRPSWALAFLDGVLRALAMITYSPTRLRDTGQLATVGHLAHADAGEAELAEVAAGAAIGHVAVTHAHGRGVTRHLVERGLGIHACLVRALGVPDNCLELGAALGEPGDLRL